MNQARGSYFLGVSVIAGLFAAVLFACLGPARADGSARWAQALLATATPGAAGRVATAAEVARVRSEWAQSGHAETFDLGQGANTTCARCKSPKNWDPAGSGQAEALDCASCKRVPGAPRPELTGGEEVAESDWRHVGCEICHEPVGDSYRVSIAFWDQSKGKYQPVSGTTELCAHCHEGQHGFEVVGEQEQSAAHQGWECTRCHGPHGEPSACTDCHNPQEGPGAPEHARHPGVNCTACHDAGGLNVWQDPEQGSRHAGQYVTRRFAHTLTSWPSHNLSREVDCLRCHHPLESYGAVLVPEVSCKACHPEGAVSFWCTYFKRNPDPNAAATESP